MMIGEFIELLKNFDNISCSDRNCTECPLYNTEYPDNICLTISKISDMLNGEAE